MEGSERMSGESPTPSRPKVAQPILRENAQGTEVVDIEENQRVATELQDKPFWQTSLFAGTYLALSLSLMGYYAGFAMPSNTLSIIEADLGPSKDTTWISTGFTLCAAVSSTFVGSMSDTFGRRYFFIGGSTLALIGTIIASRAKSVDSLIGATVLIGLGAGSQANYPFVIAEIVPFRHRYLMIGLINIFTIPVSAFGPLVARAFILHTSAAWRWNYYFGIILNGLATILWITCYFPPSFNELHTNRSRRQQILKIDFIGIILFSAGLLLFLLGLSWGGSKYSWNSAHVIATIVIGAVSLITFILYEIYGGVKEPFIPMKLFRNFQFDVITVLAMVGGMAYYSNAVIFPTLVQVFYTTDIYRVGLITCAPTAGTCAGLFIGGLVSEKFRSIKIQYIFTACSLTAFLAGLAAVDAYNEPLAIALSFLAAFFTGYAELLTEGSSTIVLDDQLLMGHAIGIFNTIRTAGGTVATTIYVAILTNKVAHDTKSIVIPAIIKAGLPVAQVEAFLAAFSSGSASAIAKVQGVTPTIIAAATKANQASYKDAFRTIYLVTIAFGACAIISAILFKEIDKNTMERGVVVRLERSANHERIDNHEQELSDEKIP